MYRATVDWATLAYDGGRLALIQDTASQQELRLSYGQFNGLTRAQRLEARPLIDNADGRAGSLAPQRAWTPEGMPGVREADEGRAR
jgi:hypothetical protein